MATLGKRLLIANRGEIAVRICQSAADLGMRTIAIYSEDDAASGHVRAADEAVALPGSGPRAYLDIEQVIAAAIAARADCVHPGYGFLSESAAFARACAAADIVFIGPNPGALDLFGDKVSARTFAMAQGVPVAAGTMEPVSLDEAKSFFAELPAGSAMLIKAVMGGGGRGMRLVTDPAQMAEAYARCTSEATAAFGSGAVYVERFLRDARHIEIQILGDGTGTTVDFGERDCTIQRRNQKLLEIAPSPRLSPQTRSALIDASLRMTRAISYCGLATCEFLLERDAPDGFVFLEINPRVQVEHTITEEVYQVDLVSAQLRVCLGETLSETGMMEAAQQTPAGFAIQARVNMEVMTQQAEALPSSGRIMRFDVPSGRGIRVDTFGYTGYDTNPRFDSLLAKLIVRAPDFASALQRCERELGNFAIDGVDTNIGFLRALLRDERVGRWDVHTRYVESEIADLFAAIVADDRPQDTGIAQIADRLQAAAVPDGGVGIPAPMQGVITRLLVAMEETIAVGQPVAVVESMKMEHLVVAQQGGRVASLPVAEGAFVTAGTAIVHLVPSEDGVERHAEEKVVDLEYVRPDLQALIDRQAMTLDASRPKALERRRRTGQRTARENIDELIDKGSLLEIGSLAVAAQRSRRSMEELVANTPADGFVTGLAHVNGAHFGKDKSRCMVMSYDYTVLAGTQGAWNHKKLDRMLKINRDLKLPIVLFAEGGGGRPGDVDEPEVTHMDVTSFTEFARFSAEVPMVGIVSGRCFAGNAALLGVCDVIIATKNIALGMAGPAMIEAGGLGTFLPDEIGPQAVHVRNGVVDIPVEDEVEAVMAARKYLSYFQGILADWECADQRLLRHHIPENRRRAYDVRNLIEIVADAGSVLELRPGFGAGIVTTLARIEGRPIGMFANNPHHLGGAIDTEAADKLARFVQLCDAHGLPMVALADTPGFMVGPDSEAQGAVRHFSRLFVNWAGSTVPLCSIVLRKAYGLGCNATTGGSFHAPSLSLSWPTGEAGPMGLEGFVQLGFRRELDAVADPDARKKLYDQLLAKEYEKGSAINIASHIEIDQVIDPAETRHWIREWLDQLPPDALNGNPARACIDTW